MNNPVAADGLVVAFNYTLRNGEGAVLDASNGDPMAYLHGHDNIVPGLERQIAGRSVGDRFTAVVPPEEGYGLKMPDALKDVPREAFGELPIEVGMDLATEVEGQLVPFWIAEVGAEVVRVDFNHPLAGVTLNFEVEVVAIRPATAEELEHGHPHGLDGHSGH